MTDVLVSAEGIRGHWSVENNLHWHLDTNFNEDANTNMDKTAFNNLSIINKMVLSILKLAQPLLGNPSIKASRKIFGWDLESKLEKVLTAFDDETLLKSISEANKK